MSGYISSFSNSHFVLRPGDPTMFECRDDGYVKVTIDGYLVIPIEAFKKRQIKAAIKRLRDKEPTPSPAQPLTVDASTKFSTGDKPFYLKRTI